MNGKLSLPGLKDGLPFIYTSDPGCKKAFSSTSKIKRLKPYMQTSKIPEQEKGLATKPEVLSTTLGHTR